MGGSLAAHFEKHADGTTRVTSAEPLAEYPRRLTDRLLHWAELQGPAQQLALKKALLKAYLTDATTGELTDAPVDNCSSQSVLPAKLWYDAQTNSPIVTFADAPVPTAQELTDIPHFLVQTGSFSGSIGSEFPPSPVVTEVQFYRDVASLIATGVPIRGEAGIPEHPQMFRDGLACQGRAVGKPRDRKWPLVTEPRHEMQARRVAECGEDWRQAGERGGGGTALG